MLLALITTAVTALALLAAAVAGQLLRLTRSLRPVEKNTIGFFHPFADGGGGGERVLWCAVRAVQRARPTARVLIYVRERAPVAAAAATAATTANDATATNTLNNTTTNTPASLAADARRRFGVDVDPCSFDVVPLKRTHLVDPRLYPSWTLARQALGSVRLAEEALSARAPPELWVDTTGWAFAYPLARLAGCRVAAYVHYPTVSADMIARVARREGPAFNNAASVSRSALRSAAKVIYYRLVALVYGACGGLGANVAMVNSSWTRGHVRRIWGPWAAARRLVERAVGLVVGGSNGGGNGSGGNGNDDDATMHLVYPPCDVARLAALPLDRALKRLSLVSVAQFRPEKDHATQLEAYARLMRAADAALGGGGGSGGGIGGGNANAGGGGLLGGLLPPPGAAQGDHASAGACGLGARLREWRRQRRRCGASGGLPFGGGGGGGLWASGGGNGGGSGGIFSALSSWMFGGADEYGSYYNEREEEEEEQQEEEEDQEDEDDGGGGDDGTVAAPAAAATTHSWLPSWLPGILGGALSSSLMPKKQKKSSKPSSSLAPSLSAASLAAAAATPPAPSPPLPPLVLTPAAARAARASCLRFVGSCRGPEDAARLASLKRRAERLGVAARCSWHENVDARELARLLGSAVGGLHSMSDEHFGIGVVEYMAAGAVPVAHDSGGPRADIVVAGWVPSKGVVVGAEGGCLASSAAGASSGGGGNGRSPSSSSGGGAVAAAAAAAPAATAPAPSSLAGRLRDGLAGPWAAGLWRRGGGGGGGQDAAAKPTAAPTAAAIDGDESYDMVDDAIGGDDDDDDGELLEEDDDYEEEDADLFEGPDERAEDEGDDGNGGGGASGGSGGGGGASGGGGGGDGNAALRLSSASRARDERRARRTAARRRRRRRGTPPVVGFLATGVDELAWAMARCLALGERARRRVAGAARRRAVMFSDARFEAAFLGAVGPVLPAAAAVADDD